jgi:hypothetical protein
MVLMGEDVENEDSPFGQAPLRSRPWIVDRCNKPVLVPAYVEDHAIPDQFGCPERFPNICELIPRRLLYGLVPMLEGTLRGWVSRPKLNKYLT